MLIRSLLLLMIAIAGLQASSVAEIAASEIKPINGNAAATQKVVASDVDANYQVLRARFNSLLAALRTIQRDDNTLADASVRLRSIATDVAALIGSKAGWQPKANVRLSTTTNVTLSNPGTSTFDGTSASTGDRILVLAQTVSSQNGIYVFNGTSSAMTRSTDADTAAEIGYTAVTVLVGTTNINKNYVLQQGPTEITLGTTGLTWALFGGGGGSGGGGGGSGDASALTVTTTSGNTARSLATILDREYNVKDFGAIGDGASHALSAGQATTINAQYGAYGLVAVAGDENDWSAIQAALYKAANTGFPVYIPTGTYRVNKPLSLKWTATPIAGQPSMPLVSAIFGDGKSSVIVGYGIAANRAVLELLGESNGVSVNLELRDLVLEEAATCNVQSYCLREGDAWLGFAARRVIMRGCNGLLMKVASSTSYAQLCTTFQQCTIWTNYALRWYAGSETNAYVYAIQVETGGAKFDNVHFDSCGINGHVEMRAAICKFTSCQFWTPSQRGTSGGINFASDIAVRIGNVSFDNCYFEDHDIAIVIVPSIADINGVSVRDCWFSGTQNFGGPTATYGILVSNSVAARIGPVHIENCHFRNLGYSVKCVEVFGTTAFIRGCSNIMTVGSDTIDDPITLDIDAASQATGVQEIHGNSGGLSNSSVVDSIKTHTNTGTWNFSGAGTAVNVTNTIAAGGVQSPFHTGTRVNTGTTAATTWGFSTSNPGNTDTMQLGYSSTTYTTGGPLSWLTNSTPFLYVPSGSTFRFGVGNAGSAYLQFGSTGIISGTHLIENTESFNGTVTSQVKNTSSGASAVAASRAVSDIATGNILAFGSNHALSGQVWIGAETNSPVVFERNAMRMGEIDGSGRWMIGQGTNNDNANMAQVQGAVRCFTIATDAHFYAANATMTATAALNVFTAGTTYTLPAASTWGGYAGQIMLFNRSGGVITFNRAGADTLNGASNGLTSFTVADRKSALIASGTASTYEIIYNNVGP